MKVKAFTLPELLIVLVIIGILVLLALPRLMPLISRTKATEAQLQLKHLQTLQKSYFYSRYSEDFQAVGFEHEVLVTNGGAANYLIEIKEAGFDGFIATATAVVDFDRDGQFNVWEIDQDNNLVEKTID